MSIPTTGSYVFFDPRKVESPSTKEEIVQIVSYAIENGQKLRVLGSGHSRSKIALSDDIILSLHHYKGVTKLDMLTKQVSEHKAIKYMQYQKKLCVNARLLFKYRKYTTCRYVDSVCVSV